jgi:hypothetical protein
MPPGDASNASLPTAEGVTPAVAAEELWLAAYSRTPTPEELQYVENYVVNAADKRLALEDVFWSVLNSKEFVFNH